MAASVLSEGPVPLHTSVYPQPCVSKAVEAYREFLDVEVVTAEEDKQVLKLAVRPDYIEQASQTRKEFLNYLLDLSAQHHLAVQ